VIRRVILGLVVACLACERQGTTTPDDGTVQGDGGDDGSEPADDGEEPAPAPRVEQELKIDGAIKKAEIDKVIEQYFREIRVCFDGGLSRNPNDDVVDGAIVVKIQVAAGGNVELAQGELNETGDEETEACIVGEVQKWSFPKKKQPSTILYPFYLRSY
jgi:hypothetical protein